MLKKDVFFWNEKRVTSSSILNSLQENFFVVFARFVQPSVSRAAIFKELVLNYSIHNIFQKYVVILEYIPKSNCDDLIAMIDEMPIEYVMREASIDYTRTNDLFFQIVSHATQKFNHCPQIKQILNQLDQKRWKIFGQAASKKNCLYHYVKKKIVYLL